MEKTVFVHIQIYIRFSLQIWKMMKVQHFF